MPLQHDLAPLDVRPHVSSAALSVERIEDERAFQALAREWDDLLAAAPAFNVFLSWDWVATWWSLYGQKSRLAILTARDGSGRLVGVAPLKRRPLGLPGLRFLEITEFIGYGGDVTPERLDFIVVAGREREVMDAFRPHLTGAQAVDLRPFDAASACLPYVEAAFGGGPGRVDRSPDAVCPVLQLPATWEAFLASRSKNYRKKIKEYQRRCERDLGARVRISASEDELMRDMEALVSLHHERWRGRSRAFQSRRYLTFHRELARRLLACGRVRLFALDTAKGPVAMLYCFTDGGRYYYYQAGRDPEYSAYRVGLVLMHRAIEQAIAEGVRVFDFLRGQEDYKYMWADGEVGSVRLSYWRSWPVRAFAHVLSIVSVAQTGLVAGSVALGALLDRRGGL